MTREMLPWTIRYVDLPSGLINTKPFVVVTPFVSVSILLNPLFEFLNLVV
jgi:hypothetical protein